MAEDFDLSGYTLFERQSKFYNGYYCPYCLGTSDFIDSIKVYQQSYGMIYYCDKCKAWVNTHHGDDKSMGTLAKKTLRDLRHQLHLKFDPLCDAKQKISGVKKKAAKSAGYNWLSKVLNIDTITCHIGYFNISQCQKGIEACDKVYAEIELKNKIAKERAELVLVLGGYIGFEVTKFEMNGLLQLELVNHNNNKFIYFPRSNEGRWIKEKKVKPIEDIEQFINSNFK